MAVGPLEPAEFWVTGGACTEAKHLDVSGDTVVVMEGRAMLFASLVADDRKAIVYIVKKGDKIWSYNK